MGALIASENLTVRYGRSLALDDVTFEVASGEALAIVGPNGAGKTSCLRAISGLVRPSGGVIRFRGRAINGIDSERIAGLGISHVPEGRRLFPGLTVEENLVVGTAAWRGRLHRKDLLEQLQHVFRAFPDIEPLRPRRAWTLSGGEQQQVAIGRALMARPDLLLLDEPSLGLAPRIVSRLFDRIREIKAAGTAILLVEQNVNMAMTVVDRVIILTSGRVRLAGSADEVREAPLLKAAYLGAG